MTNSATPQKVGSEIRRYMLSKKNPCVKAPRMVCSKHRARSVRSNAVIPVIILLVLVLLWSAIDVSFLPISSYSLPPRLSSVVQHHPRPRILPTTRPEWKRPRILTAHAIRTKGIPSLNVAIFSTGTDTQAYRRTFQAVACMIGSSVFNATIVRPEVTVCEVDPPPKDGELVTILLRVDEQLELAMEKPVTLFGEEFEILPGDVTIMPNQTLPQEGAVARVRSEILWNHRMIDVVDPARPRYELCLMTAMKQYPYLLNGFLAYYRRLGVDQVFIYDNAATTDLAKMLLPYDYVQVAYWPWTRSQMQSFTHFVRASRSRCKYVAFFDADEYMMIGSRSPGALKQYLYSRAREGYSQVISHFLRFFNNGYIRRPQGDLPVLYTRREKDQQIKLGKSIIDADGQFLFHKIHIVEGRNTKTYWNTTLELKPTSLMHNAMLMHFTKRSWEENVIKKRFGGSSPMTNYRNPTGEDDIDKPDPDYMNLEKSVPYTGFVDYWRKIMSAPLPKRESFLWKEGALWCRSEYCPSCYLKRFTQQRCNSSLF